MDQQTPTSSNLFDLQMDQQACSYLGEAARWARFLSILGFVMCGILALVGLFMGSFMSKTFNGNLGNGYFFGGPFITIIYLIIALLYFFPCLYLFHFGSKLRGALRNNDQEMLSGSFKNLKSCFKFFGILAIIALGFYAIALIAGIFGAAMSR
jgi:hypothetical protein